MDEAQKDWLATRGVIVVAPDWEFAITDTAAIPLPFKAILARPHLRKYFPGHDIYMHLDADAWIQDWDAVELYRKGAQKGVLAVTPEIDRAFTSNYRTSHSYRAFIIKVLSELAGPDVADTYRDYPILNTGVFAMPQHSPIWDRWSARIASALDHGRNFHVEQASLNLELFEHLEIYLEMGLEFLPSRCNWVCHQSLPKYDAARGLLVEPFLPHAPLGIVHRASDDFKQKKTGRIAILEGGAVEMNLKYKEGRYNTELVSFEEEHLSRWQDAGFEWTEKPL
jgi:hypothetical protein